MIETITFIVGLSISYLIIKYKNRPHYLQNMLNAEKKHHYLCKEEKKIINDENILLKNPKRLIKEYEGDSGSGTHELLIKMKNKIEALEKNIEELKEAENTLITDSDILSSEIGIKSDMLESKLIKIYDNAIINIEKQINIARDGNLNIKNKALNNLQRKSDNLNSKGI